MRGTILIVLMLAGCSHSSASADYVNPACPVSFSPGCPGACDPSADACPCPPFACEPVPKECSNSLTCDCIGCTETTCNCGLGASPNCYYDAGTFVVSCLNQ